MTYVEQQTFDQAVAAVKVFLAAGLAVAAFTLVSRASTSLSSGGEAR